MHSPPQELSRERGHYLMYPITLSSISQCSRFLTAPADTAAMLAAQGAKWTMFFVLSLQKGSPQRMRTHTPRLMKGANIGGSPPRFHLTSFFDVPANNETALMISSATHGPISVVIHAMFPEFQHYASGVFTAPCPADKTDHSVLLVGYDKEYWIVKNSFGTGWGEEGVYSHRTFKRQRGVQWGQRPMRYSAVSILANCITVVIVILYIFHMQNILTVFYYLLRFRRMRSMP